ncbi:polyamine ABC transporter substrate-binding protein [Celerinatantimonas diazotrophica]|uniref:Putrescine-binding periplasmic protein n=1 Tax=Celerinatantimonas diazotrophica TaxID=412034 RepID=A0A4R1KF68_9GAMM|nr:polyamine ABC transporter substrate-binding protein [Celerinatantimonas diazotrophica]TCK63272.1 putrescine transport system substrate-binding protein [Celerinatantimonas diazotrophica]CAG9298416.1 Putrescine-binding periplasmic protein [Celerinatantimonas diazotrophica]
MKRSAFIWSLSIAMLTSLTTFATQAKDEPVVHIYNWSDYIAKDTLPNFQKATGIKPVYDVFDSNEVLEAKILSGHSGYDVVVPSNEFLAQQAKAGAFLKLDKSKLSNYKNLDPKLMKLLSEASDPGNQYAIPYMWGTTGIGYNVKKIREILGPNAPVDSWDLVFKPKYMKKLQKCGVSFLNSPNEIMSAALNYLGKNPSSTNPDDYTKVALPMLKKIRPYISDINSSQYINDLANGDICVAIGWSGDILMAAERAEQAKNGVQIKYSIPKEGAMIWFDLMAIPKDANNPNNALKFINYILRPKVEAANSNFVWYANPVPASKKYLDPEIANDKGIYPSASVREKLFVAKMIPLRVARVRTRAWTDFLQD